MTSFLGMIVLADGYAGKHTSVALCEMPNGRLICVAHFGFWTWIGSEVVL